MCACAYMMHARMRSCLCASDIVCVHVMLCMHSPFALFAYVCSGVGGEGYLTVRARTLLQVCMCMYLFPLSSSVIVILMSSRVDNTVDCVAAFLLRQQADAVVFDALADDELLALTPPHCEHFFMGKRGGQVRLFVCTCIHFACVCMCVCLSVFIACVCPCSCGCAYIHVAHHWRVP